MLIRRSFVISVVVVIFVLLPKISKLNINNENIKTKIIYIIIMYNIQTIA